MREFRLTVEREEDPISPRDWNPLGTLYIQKLRHHVDISDNNSRRQYWEDREEWSGGVMIPLEVIEDRSSITLNPQSVPEFDDPEGEEIFDSFAGFIYVSVETLDKEYGAGKWDREKVEEILLQEIQVLQQWLDGEVYCYTLEERETEDDDWKFLDSCGGFYGDNWHTNGMRECLPIDTGSVEIEVCYG